MFRRLINICKGLYRLKILCSQCLYHNIFQINFNQNFRCKNRLKRVSESDALPKQGGDIKENIKENPKQTTGETEQKPNPNDQKGTEASRSKGKEKAFDE